MDAVARVDAAQFRHLGLGTARQHHQEDQRHPHPCVMAHRGTLR